MKFSNSYIKLGKPFYQSVSPTPVANPQLFLWNDTLAEQLLFDKSLADKPAELAQIFSGNQLLPGSEPIALAYAGHQFGQFNPQLGDGRAHLLGEVIDRDGQRMDIQLKGSGPTPFSRGGDGRCALGPALREFIMSEAMAALGVPTSRALAVVTTGETVYRQMPSPGAVVTRVAASHLRIGTFQFFAARNNQQALQALADYTLERHYSKLPEMPKEERYLALLDAVIARQIQLVVHWMRVGFIHGVMNTDNTSLCGETIDYGPCAMMSNYDPQTVFSSIDANGRYAFGNQPDIAHWNMARFAECLAPLVDNDPQQAVEKLMPLINEFPRRFEQAFTQMMGRKLGLTSLQQGDDQLITDLLDNLAQQQLDYTITFHRLTQSLSTELDDPISAPLGDWPERWRQRLRQEASTAEQTKALMRQHNPVVIPRNHTMEAVLRDCEQSGEATAAQDFLKVLRSPYQELPETGRYQEPPPDGDSGYRTFCGT